MLQAAKCQPKKIHEVQKKLIGQLLTDFPRILKIAVSNKHEKFIVQ
jgi:hypothetical protein